MATGLAAPNGDWALGQAWRMLYPVLVTRQRQVARDRHAPLLGHARAAGWAAQLERLAFGPPPVNAAKLAALMTAGAVEVRAGDAASTARRLGAAAVVDGVLAPPGVRAVHDPLWTGLLGSGTVGAGPRSRGIRIDEDANCLDAHDHPVPGLSAAGRVTEDVVMGNDTLVRMHPELDRWARRLLGLSGGSAPSAVAGRGRAGRGARASAQRDDLPALPARTLPWQRTLLGDHARLDALIAEYGSPINLIEPGPLPGHAQELIEAARERGVTGRIFFARKANKTLALVDAVLDAGHGVDVASLVELRQVLSRGAAPDSVIVTAAVKPRALVEMAVAEGVTVSVDNTDELDLLRLVARDQGRRPSVALRLSPDLPDAAPSRFGMPAEQIRALLTSPDLQDGTLRLEGFHVHVHGYRVVDRVRAAVQLLTLVEQAREAGHPVRFLDLGGGVPMRYLDDPDPWEEFWRRHRAGLLQGWPLTWAGRGLGLNVSDGRIEGTPAVYPMWQDPVRGAWLGQVLDADVGCELPGSTQRSRTGTIGQWFADLGVDLHLEPGRALLDGCGMTVARVEFRKDLPAGATAGEPDPALLVGLAMNRTQCRSAADDFLLDPVLVPQPADRRRGRAGPGYLVGAYCIEAELLTWRRLPFPHGAAVGDLVAFVNTAGYQMHILESASHQMPLARNLVPGPNGGWVLDDVDAAS